MRRATALAWAMCAVIVAAGCAQPIVGCNDTSDCTAPLVCRANRCVGACLTTADCSSGEVCIGGGCTAPLVDAGLDAIDDTGTCSPDLDRDGHCGDTDCDDADPEVFVGAAEICTPSDGSTPRDESCDGRLDEACPFYFGTPHEIVELGLSEASSYWPRLGDGGNELCFANGRAHCARRASASERFGRAVEIESLMPGASVTAVELSSDGLEAFVEAVDVTGTGLFHARRSATSSPFDTATLLGVRLFHPALSADDLELVAQSRPGPSEPSRLVRATRATTAESFDAFEMVDLAGEGDGAPFLHDDGTLWFTRATGALIENFTATPVGSGFGEVTALEGLEDGATHLFYSQPTRELFFIGRRGNMGRYTVLRARVCRDGPCRAGPSPCPATVMGTASADQVHCYWSTPTSGGWQESADRCVADGGHLATIHGPEENALVGSGTAEQWLGGSRRSGRAVFEWITGEPFFFTAWDGGEPSEPMFADAAIAITAGGWNDRAITTALPAICEADYWPTW